MSYQQADEHLRRVIALWSIPSVTPGILMPLLHHFSDISELFSTDEKVLAKWKLSPALLKQLDWQAADAAMAWASQPGQHIIVLGETRYPKLLAELAVPPPLLFVKGQYQVLQSLQLAMVGSRNPSATGKDNAYQFAHYLANTGFVITSGLAYGIDSICHQAAVDAGKATVAVLGSGLENIYPPQHSELAESIADNGAVISEFSLDALAKAKHFPQRNRIISGLSVGTVVIEAALRSGSLITARYALEQNREVFAIPGSIHNPLARGCHSLLKQGAKLVEFAQDIIEELAVGLNYVKEEPVSVSLMQLGPVEQKLVQYIGDEVTPIDTIVNRSGMAVNEVSAMLVELELHNAVESVPGGYIRI